jgi:hypothetical protein
MSTSRSTVETFFQPIAMKPYEVSEWGHSYRLICEFRERIVVDEQLFADRSHSPTGCKTLASRDTHRLDMPLSWYTISRAGNSWVGENC